MNFETVQDLLRNPNAPSRYAKVAKIMGSAEVSSSKSGKYDFVLPPWKPPPIEKMLIIFNTNYGRKRPRYTVEKDENRQF